MKTLLDLVGNTPLLDLGTLFNKNNNVSVFAKAEWLNPSGSLKDRSAKRILIEAIKNNELTKDKIIIDSSSGNAGISYSMIGNALGYSVNIVIPENASCERKKRMLLHGTKIIETDAIEGYDEALRHVYRLTEKNPHKYFFCDQYANENNLLAHYYGTAEEIIHQLKGKSVDYFIGGIGTGGSITGIGRKLKEVFKHVTVIGIRPEVWPGIEGLKPLASPEDIIPKIYDDTIVDQWIDITADEAKNWANLVAKKGFFIGHSSGAYLAATSKLLKKIKSGNVITIINDLGERYFSTGLWG